MNIFICRNGPTFSRVSHLRFTDLSMLRHPCSLEIISLRSSALQTVDTLPAQEEKQQSDGDVQWTVCVYIYLYVLFTVFSNLVPAECVSRQPQMAVGAGVCLIRHFRLSRASAGPVTAPQGATCGVGGPSHAKVRSRVCLVAHFVTTRGQRGQRIRVLLHGSSTGV